MAETVTSGHVAPWRGEAFNQEPDSPNEIHGDRLARQYGFRGGLVPGVTVSAYLLHPAVEAWGLDFLARGLAEVRVTAPLYDREPFSVEIPFQARGEYRAVLEGADGMERATAVVSLPRTAPPAPRRRGDPLVDLDYVGPPASRERWETLRREGCSAQRFRWQPGGRMGTYLRDESAMPELLRGPQGFANAAFVLGLSNWITAANAHMNPWVHLQTRSRHFRPIPAGCDIIAELRVADLFGRKGHEFVDVVVDLYGAADDACLATVELRAIYRLRGV